MSQTSGTATLVVYSIAMTIALNYYIVLEKGQCDILHVVPNQRMFEIRDAIYRRQSVLFARNKLSSFRLKLYAPKVLKKDQEDLFSYASHSISACEPLKLFTPVRTAFGENELDMSLIHLVVMPQESATVQPSTPIGSLISPREATVSGIWDKLMKYKIIWVCGPPGSGKSTLAKLLHQHSQRCLPNAQVIHVDGWLTEDEVMASSGLIWQAYLAEHGWDAGAPVPKIFIFDEAQMTYDDRFLWAGHLKNLWDYARRYAIGFASHGAAEECLDRSTVRAVIAPVRTVTLQPIDYNDDYPAVGLLFTRKEFDDVVRRRYEIQGGHHFDETFLDGLFKITGGYIGAIVDVLNIIESDNSYRDIKHSVESSYFSWNTFQTYFPPGRFLEQIMALTGTLKKGLPTDEDLQAVSFFNALSAVAQKTVVTYKDVPEGIENTLKECTYRGWLHSDNVYVSWLRASYFFASSLHQWYVQWKLFRSRDPEKPLGDSLMEFVMSVFRLFNTRALSEKQGLGPACLQRPPAARYQDEFYRCSHAYSGGSIVTFLEFGLANGRVDFYVPSRKWGIELLCDGDRLSEHSGRFSQPDTCRESLPLNDYVILDCRTTEPQSGDPSLNKLYHVVFGDNYKKVTILDNRKQVVNHGEFMLSYIDTDLSALT